MFKQMEPHLTKLKTNDNKTITVCYGESPIQLGTMPFYNYKNSNEYLGEDNQTYVIYEASTKNIKMQATVHTIKIRTTDWHTGYSGSNVLPNILIRPAYATNDIQYPTNDAYGISVPKLNDIEMSTNFINFINNLKSKKLNQLLTKIYYFVTHGNTPYSNIDFQQNPTFFNSFLSVSPNSGVVIHSDLPSINTHPLPTGNNYPQCALLGNAPRSNLNAMPFVNTNPYSWMNGDGTWDTFPSLGIYFSGHKDAYQEYTHIYWTTYKGV